MVPSELLVTTSNPWHSWACRCILQPLSLYHWHSPCVSLPLLLIISSVFFWIRAHPNDLILNWLHLQRPSFQKWSHSQVLGVRTSTYLFISNTYVFIISNTHYSLKIYIFNSASGRHSWVRVCNSSTRKTKTDTVWNSQLYLC